MIKIRNGCFETNSSSSHAMIMMKQDLPLPQVFETNNHVWKGKITIWTDDLEFGRSPFSVLTDWYHRMCYAIASYGKAGYDDILTILYKRIAGLQEVEIYGAKTEYAQYGYVDHQSMGLLQSFLKEHNISLEDFIFNDRYIVVIDGDEYCVFDSMIEAGLIDKTKIKCTKGVYPDD